MSLDVRQNIPLAPHTTFGIGGVARYFVSTKTEGETLEALEFAKKLGLEVFVLGGGSNILVSDRGFDGLVIQPNLEGFFFVDQGQTTLVTIAAAETWSGVVDRCVAAGLWGIENLAFIPGRAGALAIQNVNAYGQRASDVLDHVVALDRKTHEQVKIDKRGCGFGYRSSIFNTIQKGRYVITSVTLKLSTLPQANLAYPDVTKYFQNNPKPSLRQIADAITLIRRAKGQDPDQYRSAGSFFKNIILDEPAFSMLQNRINDYFGRQALQRLLEIAARFKEGERYKIPLAFILDELLHLKGAIRHGDAMISPLQVLNIINCGHARASDVLAVYADVRKQVYSTTGIIVEAEPEFVGFRSSELDAYQRLDA